eukprot:CAMPEP_0118695038 /NCGR_PEP_ID=MMETSP0800-20121206/12931_1 /TAXON_ID=210618 ORGANISM="Striatella unipunctata, Strain CCMP2910" /NCGR_SAMPLE_ID=MMETSP0800 /ASSEMBLY_ACC=CAM_ASM_000638 /LENGTH=278 /DNA_ID=CAMNT_0006593719 /DNA_START=1089 /DNA_END=1921 /DNA_ORIENTATION=-
MMRVVPLGTILLLVGTGCVNGFIPRSKVAIFNNNQKIIIPDIQTGKQKQSTTASRLSVDDLQPLTTKINVPLDSLPSDINIPSGLFDAVGPLITLAKGLALDELSALLSTLDSVSGILDSLSPEIKVYLVALGKAFGTEFGSWINNAVNVISSLHIPTSEETDQFVRDAPKIATQLATLLATTASALASQFATLPLVVKVFAITTAASVAAFGSAFVFFLILDNENYKRMTMDKNGVVDTTNDFRNGYEPPGHAPGLSIAPTQQHLPLQHTRRQVHFS